MQALPPRPPSRIRLPFLTNIAAAGDNLVLENNYKHYAQLSQRAFLQAVAQQCGVDSIELVSTRDLGVRIVAASRAANALAVAALSSLLRLDISTQSQAKPGLLMVPLSLANRLRGELTRIRSEYRDMHIIEGSQIAPAEAFPVLLMASPRLPAVEAEARMGQAVLRLQETLLAAETKYPSYQQHPPPQQQQQQQQKQHLVSPWGHVPGEQPQQQQQQQQQQQISTMSGGGFGGGGSQAVSAWAAPQATTSPASTGSSPPSFWQSHSSSPSLSFPPPLLTPTALLHVLHQHYGLVPAEPESNGRDFFQEWSLLVHGTLEMSGQVRESIAVSISRHEDLLRYAAGLVPGSTNSEPAAAAAAAAEEYLQVVRSDWSSAGGRLEMEAASRCFDVRLAVFDAEEQSFWQFHPLPLPLSLRSSPGGGSGLSPLHTEKEVFLLQCHGLCWLMLKEEEAAAGGGMGEAMETEVVVGDEKEREMDDLSISLQSVASAGMLDA